MQVCLSLSLVMVLVLFQTVTTGAYKCEPDPPNNKTICRLEAVADTFLYGMDSYGAENILIVAKHPWYDLKRTVIRPYLIDFMFRGSGGSDFCSLQKKKKKKKKVGALLRMRTSTKLRRRDAALLEEEN